MAPEPRSSMSGDLTADRRAWLGLGHVKFDLISGHSGRMVQSEIPNQRSGKTWNIGWRFQRPWCGSDC